MSEVVRYAVCADPDEWGDAVVFDTYEEARTHASSHDECVIELTYEYSDSELVDDLRKSRRRLRRAHQGDRAPLLPQPLTAPLQLAG